MEVSQNDSGENSKAKDDKIMHARLEVVMPPVQDVEAAIEGILKPFREGDGIENPNDPDDYLYSYEDRHAFYDYYQIGGRYSGEKILDAVDQEKLKEFREWMVAEKITVSGLVWGKQELSPASQAAKVDAKWQELFGTKTCPIFNHSNECDEVSQNNFMTVAQCKESAKAHHAIIAAPSYNDGNFDGPLQAKTMWQDSIWNGVSHVKSAWDGKIGSMIDAHNERMSKAKESVQRVSIVQDDWLVVTVDYHT